MNIGISVGLEDLAETISVQLSDREILDLIQGISERCTDSEFDTQLLTLALELTGAEAENPAVRLLNDGIDRSQAEVALEECQGLKARVERLEQTATQASVTARQYRTYEGWTHP